MVTLVHPYTNFPMTFRVVVPVAEAVPPDLGNSPGLLLQEVEMAWTPTGLGWCTVKKDKEAIEKTFPAPPPAADSEIVPPGSPEGQPSA